MTFLLIVLCGTAGGLLFHWLHVPGGPMLGAVLAVLAGKLLGQLMADTPALFQSWWRRFPSASLWAIC